MTYLYFLTINKKYSMIDELMILPPPSEYRIQQILFSPLLSGQPIILSVKDDTLFKKARALDILLFLVPLSHIGIHKDNRILASIPGYGSELFSLDKKIRDITFLRLGISPVLASALVKALTDLIN